MRPANIFVMAAGLVITIIFVLISQGNPSKGIYVGSDFSSRINPSTTFVYQDRSDLGYLAPPNSNAESSHKSDNSVFLHTYEPTNGILAWSALHPAALTETAGNLQTNSSAIREVTYTAKFECGSVARNDGPLRPGHYDTDVSIFNRQNYPVSILWNVVINDAKGSTSILKNLQPQTSTSIICKDIVQLFNNLNSTGGLVEGFVVIRPQVNTGGLGASTDNTATAFSRPLSKGDLNMLDVQVFYSANALLSLPRNITMDKVLFSIINESTGKIPQSMLGKTLDITLESQVNQILDPESQVRDILAAKYQLSNMERLNLEIKIISVSLGTSTMIDDHAISSSQILPEYD
jgi:hypothetical protein